MKCGALLRLWGILAAVLAASAWLPARAEDMDKASAQSALAAARRNLQLSDARSKALMAEVQALKKDSGSISRALAAAAKAERLYAAESAAAAKRLGVLAAQSRKQRAALRQRQAELAEILAGLEKLGANPPPALFVRADDAAESLAAAALLGGLLPQMQEKAALVRAKLQELAAVEDSVKAERQRLSIAQENHISEQMRLSLLLEEKAQMQSQKRQNLRQEEANRRNLAEKAQSLQDLLAEIAKQKPSADSAAAAGQMRIADKFSALRGALSPPAAGRLLAGFGQKTAGKAAQGEIVETAFGATVSAPAEAVVRYAGAFRSYGQMLILDMGENYYLILAGLAHIHVASGQFLLQGEPLGVMENILLAGQGSLMMGKAAPKLYLELRKDGKPVDPAPWWAAAGGGQSRL